MHSLNNDHDHRSKSFVVTSICRYDMIDCLIDMNLTEDEEDKYVEIIDNLSDEQMKEIAGKLAEETYNDHDFWEHLQCICEEIEEMEDVNE